MRDRLDRVLLVLALLCSHPAFERALARKDEARAFALFTSRLGFGPPPWLPIWLLALGARLLLRGDQGREIASLMHTIPADLQMARALHGDVERYRAIECPVLLLGGERSPPFLLKAFDLLAPQLRHGRGVRLPAQGHNAPDITGVGAVARLLDAWSASAT